MNQPSEHRFPPAFERLLSASHHSAERAWSAFGATVVHQLVQQALLQVLEPTLEPHFSEHSYGFRPGRSAIRRSGKGRPMSLKAARWSLISTRPRG